MKKNTWTIVGVVVVVLLIGSVIFSNQAAETANEGVVFSDHVKGNAEATVVLAEYSDFQCPACAQAFPVVQDILEQFGEDLRFEYHHFPLISIHPYAVPAARAAEAAAQQGKFFEMHDKLFENQSVWSASGNPQASFIQYASEIGLDMTLFKRHLGASVINDKIQADFRTAQTLGFTGTPTFTLNGERVNFASFEDLVTQIQVAIENKDTVSAPAAPTDVEFGI